MEPELILDAKAAHGEGPVWLASEGMLAWVDITACALHICDPATGRDRMIPTGAMIGAAAPRASGGMVTALDNGFAFIDTATGQVTPICDPESDIEGNRFNDGKCDPAGRFWAGTCSLNCDVPGAGSLYCLDESLAARKVLGELTISNGLTWSADHKTMYFIDTPTFEIWAFDYKIETGAISNRRVAVPVPQDAGYPDGMTIDAEGALWVAHWGTSCVCRWDPNSGEKLEAIRFPVENVSCPTFGGPNLGEMYVTSSRLGLDESALQSQPLAGGVFRVSPGVRGTETWEFVG